MGTPAASFPAQIQHPLKHMTQNTSLISTCVGDTDLSLDPSWKWKLTSSVPWRNPQCCFARCVWIVVAMLSIHFFKHHGLHI